MKHNFAWYANLWLERKQCCIKKSSYERYKNMLCIHILVVFGDYKIEEITENMMIDYFKSKKDLSASTQKMMKYLIRSIIEESGISSSLCFKNIKLQPLRVNTTTLNNSQFECLSNYCLNHYNRISRAVMLALYGGLRIGEVCALKWKDVDLDSGLLYVNQSVIRLKEGLQLNTPKTSSSQRVVPMPSVLIDYLKMYEIKRDSFVVSNSMDLYDPRCVQRCFKTLCKKYHFNMHFHALRHTYATTCMMRGMDMKSLSEILGHSNVSITLSLYVHSSIEHKKKQVDRVFERKI